MSNIWFCLKKTLSLGIESRNEQSLIEYENVRIPLVSFQTKYVPSSDAKKTRKFIMKSHERG